MSEPLINEELFEQCKRKLRITYDDIETNARIEDAMGVAEAELIDLLGIDVEGFDFSKPSTENELFKAYVFYEYNDATDEFETNYAKQIARCRNKWMVKQYVEKQEAPADLS